MLDIVCEMEMLMPCLPGGGGGRAEVDIGEIWYGEMWHNQIVPHCAMVFKDRSHLLRCA